MTDKDKKNFDLIWEETIEKILGEVEDVDKDILDFDKIRDEFYRDCKTLFLDE